jgi:hypothetical protein
LATDFSTGLTSVTAGLSGEAWSAETSAAAGAFAAVFVPGSADAGRAWVKVQSKLKLAVITTVLG